ncbi:MAG: hypothetical protein ACI33S_03760, partial [Bacilli bacterium]
ILDELNEFLKIYPLIMDSNENMLYQEKVAKKYTKNSIFNGTSSAFCSSFSLFLSEQLLDADISDFKEFSTIFIASLVGFVLLQKGNKKSYFENSLNVDEFINNADAIDEKFYSISDNLVEAVADYVNTSSYFIDEFLENDMVKDIFVNNADYINSKILDYTYAPNFGYDSVSEAFNEVFDIEGGFTEYIYRNCVVVCEDDSEKVRKR